VPNRHHAAAYLRLRLERSALMQFARANRGCWRWIYLRRARKVHRQMRAFAREARS
jgi:hypothetical protein